jgi:hypothetical protein
MERTGGASTLNKATESTPLRHYADRHKRF